MYKKPHPFAVVLVFVLLFPFFSHFASAQVGLSLFPIKFRVTIDPGKSYSDTVTVINPNNYPIGIKPEVENISGGDEGSVDLIDTDIPHGVSGWIQIDKSQFDLAPQERKQIHFTITVPQNGEPGGHYGAILFRGMPPSGSAQNGVGISGRIGSVVLVEVSGKTEKTGKLSNLTGPSYVDHGPVEFSFSVQNTGNTHFDPQGTVSARGLFIKNTNIPYEPRIVFPGKERTFKAVWDTKYLFGPITVTAAINMPNGGAEVKTLSFFAFPWQEALVVLGLIVLLLFVFRTFKTKFKIVRVAKNK
ncbi:MAG: hypothetical protein WCW78_02010 [Candidatus Paceibacterota bacterium]|jgi:hypothetical protein